MISVIIPAYNEEKYLASTIASVRSQNVPHEVITVCNGCTDRSIDIAKKLSDHVIILRERGVSRARNEGAKQAKYKTLVFLDADTILSPNVLKEISKRNGFGTARPAAYSKTLKDKAYFFMKYLTQFAYSSAGLIFTSKDIYQKVGGFSEEMSKFEDGNFLKKAKQFGNYNVVYDPVYTSTRRYQKKGYIGTVIFWIKEYFKPSEKEYDAIR